MKHLTILVPAGGLNLSSIVGSYKIFSRANLYWQQHGKKPLFTIQLAGLSKNVKFHDGLFTVHPTLVTTISKTHLIIIPSLDKNFQPALEKNKKLGEWLTQQYKRGAEIASICTGAFLLASTGLVDDKSCSTHWIAADAFRKMFPNVHLCTDKIITDEHGIYTNGGAFSFLNLVLYLIEKYYDKETAIYCSKVFQIEPDRQSQSPFTIFASQKNHDDAVVREAQDLIEKNLHDKLAVDSLATRLAVSRRNFDRRFMKATGNTPVEYQQRVKVEAAKKMLELSRKNVSEVMFDVGYADSKAFRDVFRRLTGMAPAEYKMRYNRERVV
ncbi:GlxA family transcriptional regulator [Chryseolinea lacunae]|uniref:Helix-turn-helix domain-containing protein n=1 Tax=Chryseolinea lacunae TaxID=2801331 RepID=A0ABS1KZ03_9BACT|nr:helix-turn-helix domain-containing protein [Chryseolinea lacunae]MBL0743917.1 helix-turn-helix domain-containing protein [Chryseolinea lacunae]